MGWLGWVAGVAGLGRLPGMIGLGWLAWLAWLDCLAWLGWLAGPALAWPGLATLTGLAGPPAQKAPIAHFKIKKKNFVRLFVDFVFLNCELVVACICDT